MKYRNMTSQVMIVCALGAALITLAPPAQSQTTSTNADGTATTKLPSNVQHGDPEKALQQAKEEVKTFRDAFAQLCKAQGLPVAVSWIYADNFEFVDLDGKKMNRSEFLQSGRVSTEKEDAKALKEQGGKTLPLADDQRYWRPERIEVSGREITVYTSPVSKNLQAIPIPGGGTKMSEVKVLGTDKQVFVKQDNGLLRLKRQEMVGVKIFVDGKPLSKETLDSKIPAASIHKTE